jgi:hypothetical protein
MEIRKMVSEENDQLRISRWRFRRVILSLVVCWLLATTCQAQSAETPMRPQKLRLAAIQAMLFFENTGKFSPDVFTNQVNLWNTPLEGASREGASESMLVIVEIRAEGDGVVPTKRKVQLNARYRIEDGSRRGKPAFFSKTMNINIGSEGKFFAAFWVYDTGCYPVELVARIVGQKDAVRKTIQLGCGE